MLTAFQRDSKFIPRRMLSYCHVVCVLQGVTVRALILLNPQNPLGDIYSLSELRDYLEFAKRYASLES